MPPVCPASSMDLPVVKHMCKPPNRSLTFLTLRQSLGTGAPRVNVQIQCQLDKCILLHVQPRNYTWAESKLARFIFANWPLRSSIHPDDTQEETRSVFRSCMCTLARDPAFESRSLPESRAHPRTLRDTIRLHNRGKKNIVVAREKALCA